MDLDFQPDNIKPGQPKPNFPIDSEPVQPAMPSNLPPSASSINSQPKPVASPPVMPPAVAKPSPAQSMKPVEPPSSSHSKLLPILLVILILLIIAGVTIFFVLPLFSEPKSTDQPANNLSSSPPATATNESTPSLPTPTTPAGRDAQRKQDLKLIETLLASYFTDNGSYPIMPTVEKLNTSGIVTTALVPTYVSALPLDPLDPEFYYGYRSADGKTYELSARVEDSTDAEATLVGSKYLYFLRK